MNKVILLGRLTADPEISYAQGDEPIAVAKFTVAVDRSKKDEADFIRCTAFRKTAEFLNKYFKKGNRILLEGRWQTGSYKKDDKTIYTNDCIVDKVEFCESKSSADNTEKSEFVDASGEELPFK